MIRSLIDPYELLTKELGPQKVIRDEARLERFLVDESGLGRWPAECAVLAESRDEIVQVLAWARAHKVPVTPRGAGTGMTGGALPVRGGVILSTEKMTRVLEIDPQDLVAVVEPGVITGQLQTRVESEGLFYPPDPASLDSCSLGGNVAENAGGPRAFKYGVTREYVLGLESVLMGGELLRCGRRTPKGVTGYDVTAALVGSEGTFAVVSEMTLKLLPRPPAVATLLAVFADLLVAGEAVSRILQLGARPRALELLDRMTLDHLRGRTPYRIPESAGRGDLVRAGRRARGAGRRAAALRERLRAVGRRRDPGGAKRKRAARPVGDAAARQPAAQSAAPPQDSRGHRGPAARHSGDAPPRRRHRRRDQSGVPCATYGHAGDGNLHITLLVDDDDAGRRIETAMDAIMRATLDLGGTLAGEHGVGLLKMKYLPWEQSPPLLRVQRDLKRVFDPDDLLNPGKILP